MDAAGTVGEHTEGIRISYTRLSYGGPCSPYPVFKWGGIPSWASTRVPAISQGVAMKLVQSSGMWFAGVATLPQNLREPLLKHPGTWILDMFHGRVFHASGAVTSVKDWPSVKTGDAVAFHLDGATRSVLAVVNGREFRVCEVLDLDFRVFLTLRWVFEIYGEGETLEVLPPPPARPSAPDTEAAPDAELKAATPGTAGR